MHGEFRLLTQFIEKVGFDFGKDRLIAAGDLVDRGPQSRELLDLFGGSPKWFHSVLGNHDAMFREAMLFHSFDAERTWWRNGGNWFEKVSPEHREQLKQAILRMPLAIEVLLSDGRRVGVVHAEIPVGLTWSDVDNFIVRGDEAADVGNFNGNAVLWGRSRVRNALMVRKYPRAEVATMGLRSKTLEHLQPVPGIDLLVMGHTRLDPQVPLPVSNLLWIDTGGGYEGGRLTFVDLAASEYVQLSHTGRRFRRGKLRRPWSLKGWQLTKEQKKLAAAELEIQEKKNRRVLAMFGFAYPDDLGDTPVDGKKDPDPSLQ